MTAVLVLSMSQPISRFFLASDRVWPVLIRSVAAPDPLTRESAGRFRRPEPGVSAHRPPDARPTSAQHRGAGGHRVHDLEELGHGEDGHDADHGKDRDDDDGRGLLELEQGGDGRQDEHQRVGELLDRDGG